MSDIEVRILLPEDTARLKGFLDEHKESSLFLRSNLRAAGLIDGGNAYEGTYAALLEGGCVRAVAAHYWNGNVILQAPERVGELIRLAQARSLRPLQGLIGPWDQVREARRDLGLEQAETHLDSKEDLFVLPLSGLKIPAALREGRVLSGSATPEELPLLAGWRRDYNIEAVGLPPSEGLLAESRRQIERTHRDGALFVLRAGGRPVSMCAFNAREPDCVQIGGVFTPVAERGRGYGRAVVAGALLTAMRQGVDSSVLFTGIHNAAARMAYTALGYRRVGDYGLLLFREGHLLPG